MRKSRCLNVVNYFCKNFDNRFFTVLEYVSAFILNLASFTDVNLILWSLVFILGKGNLLLTILFFHFQRDKSQLELVIVCLLYYQVYRKCYGEHVGFKMFMDAWLLSLARKVSLGSNFMSSRIIYKLSLKKFTLQLQDFIILIY